MAKDVIITPASGLIDFKNASGVSVSTIQLADNGTLSLGNTASNLYIGDGTNSVDIIFEQNGKIRALTGKTLTLGQSDSAINLNAPLTYTSPDASKTVTSTMLNSGSLSFTGSTGQLLSITNSFTGTIFSANDSSGVPSIEVLDTGVVKIGQYSGNILVGTGVDDGINKVQVNGLVKATGLRELKIAVSASAIDLATGSYFSKTISGATTFTLSNVPASGTAITFLLDLTNGGSATVTWWSGIKWASGTVPTLTSSGRDVLVFFTHDGGTTWTGVITKDVK